MALRARRGEHLNTRAAVSRVGAPKPPRRAKQIMTGLNTRSLFAGAILWVACDLASPVVLAQQPTVKDLLGKAQTQSEAKAVEDLIGKLERRNVPPKSSSPVPPNDTPSASATPPATEQAQPKTTSNEPIDSNPPASTPTPQIATEPPLAAEARADAPQSMPSVELEVLFEYKSARLTPAAAATLTPLGRALTDARLVDDFFLIAGHTDAKGGADFNVRLSQQRAEAVRDFLVKQFKVDAKRLVARGFGDRRLKDPQNPFDDKNRRVQVINFTPPKAQ